MFDKQEFEQAKYFLAQHYLTRLKTYSDLYKLKNQASIAAHQFEMDRSQIEYSLTWVANIDTDHAAGLYLDFNDAGSTLFADQQSFDRRLIQYKTAVDFARKLKKMDAVALNLSKLGTLHRDLAKYEEAQNYAQEALALAIELDIQWLIADCYNELGLISKRLGHQKEAWNSTQKALEIARTIENDFRIAKFLRNLSTIAYEMGNLETAIELARESHAIFEVVGTPREIAQGAYTIGSLLLMLPDLQLEDARKFLWQSYKMYDRIGNKRMVASVACNIASDLIKNQNKYEEAIELAQEALVTYRTLNYPLGICNALTILGEATLELGEVEQAQQLYSEGLTLALETKSAWDIIMLYVGLGVISKQTRDFETAQDYLLKALRVAIDGSMEALALLVLVHLAIPLAHQTRQTRRVVEYIGLVLAHPKSNAVVITDAGVALSQLQQDFPSFDFTQALEKGKNSDLHRVAEELLNDY